LTFLGPETSRGHFSPFTDVQNGNQRGVMRKVGFASLSRYGGATTDDADVTDKGRYRRRFQKEDNKGNKDYVLPKLKPFAIFVAFC
jgi:hypothetical protein